MNDEPLTEEPRCACGAQLAEGETQCRKCRASCRWLRRQLGRRKADKRRDVPRPADKRRSSGRPGRLSEIRAVRS